MVTFDSRADIGLIDPISRPRIPGPVYGTAAHYNGGAMYLLGKSHSYCRSAWRGIQGFHMGKYYDPPRSGRNWHDIAYSFGVCHHDVILAGRGHGVRTAANGTTSGNDHWYAGMFLIGGKEEPTEGMLRAFLHAANGFGAPKVVPHSYFKSTACPGDPVRSRIVNDTFDIEDIMAEGHDPIDRAAHSAAGVPSWSPWDKYTSEGGSTVPESGVWPVHRFDLAWFSYNGPLADRVKRLEGRVAELEREIEALKASSGDGDVDIDSIVAEITRRLGNG